MSVKNIVIWRGVGGRGSVHTEAILALALKHRGHKPQFVMCDNMMSACIQGGGVGVNRPKCSGCYSSGASILGGYGLSHINFSSLVPKKRREKFRKIVTSLSYNGLENYIFHNVPVGKFARNSLDRHLRGAPTRSRGRKPLREFLFSSLVCLDAARVYYHQYRPDFAIFQRHFEYVGWGPAYHYFSKNKGMRITTWGGSLDFSKQITMLNCGSDYPSLYRISDESWKELSNTGLTKAEGSSVDKYLKPGGISRNALLQQVGVSDDKPIWCVFPHVHWEGGLNLNSPQWPFDSIDDWLFTTIQAILNTPGITWILKAHPFERRGTERGVIQIIKDKFPNLEERVIMIPPNAKIRANDLSLILSGGITLQGSVSIELSALGVPMIVGNSKYPGKEFTYSEETREGYINLIHNAVNIESLSPKQQDLARMFLGYIRVRRKLPFKAAKGNKGYSPIIPSKKHLLLPGKDAVMDMICHRIIHGGEFVI